MGFEDNFLRNLDWRRGEGRQEISPTLEQAHRRAATMFRDPDYSVQEADFVRKFGAESIRSDQAYVTRLRSKFDRERSDFERNSYRIAEVFEAIMLDQAELSEWFGDVHTLKASAYDDIVNKIDMIAEWHTPEAGSQVLGIGIDVTYSRDSVQKKLGLIRQGLDQGRLGTIKYFKDGSGNILDSRHHVPRIVLGVEQKMVEELAYLWVHGDKERLANHPIQRLCLIEMEVQLREGLARARRTGNQEIIAAYEQAYSVVRPLEVAKRGIDLGITRTDGVANEIVNETKRIFNE